MAGSTYCKSSNTRSTLPPVWASTIGALALLVAYLLVAGSAAGTLLRSKHPRDQWLLFIPALGAVAIGYTMWVNVYPPY